MSIATITSKGQITLPKDVRTRLHLEAGEKIAFRVDESTGEAVLTPLNKTVDEVFGLLGTGKKLKGRTPEQMNLSIAAHVREQSR
jgi:AbrB family looped-hinge helix DNA binding protein